MFTIKITYETGNTFNHGIEEDLIEIKWGDLSKAKLALECIKQHHDFLKKLENTRRYNSGSSTKESILDEMSTYAWFDQDMYEFYLKLPTDDGQVRVRAFWKGYFEVLHRAEVIIVGDDDDTLSYDFI